MGEFAALAGGRQCGWRYIPSLVPSGAAAAVDSRGQQSYPEGFLAVIFFFFDFFFVWVFFVQGWYFFSFSFETQERFYWRAEFIIQVEEKKAGLKMEIESNECCFV